MTEIRKYGCTPDDKDNRDLIYKVTAPIPIPDVVDLRPHFPAPYDQLRWGSCVANAIGGGIEYDQMKQGNVTLKNLAVSQPNYFMPSRFFIYNLARYADGNLKQDAGTQIRTAIKVVVDKGVCPEFDFQYIQSNLYKLPPKSCIKKAIKYNVLRYERVLDLNALMQCLANGYPVVIGMQVFEEMESEQAAQTGIVHMPANPNNVLGGHGVLCVGLFKDKRQIITRNSWGQWGDHGYFYLPFDYFEPYVTDMWVITYVNI